jgi:enamine deaminase RidA (YjgF/YER057c/UK114 family)
MKPANPPRNVNPEDLGPARGFSHATVAAGLVWLGGQIGSDATGKVPEPGDITAQFARAVRNVSIALRAVGSAPADIVKLTYYVTDLKAYKDNLRAIGSAYREVFGRHYPATTLVEVRSLFDPDALIEIDAIAVCPA